MQLQLAALIFGVVFVLVGVLGFVPGAAPNGMLLGIFHVNDAHNIVHILSGIAALAAYYYGARASQAYFRVFGVIYAIVAVMGFFVRDGYVLGVLANNAADNWLHVFIAGVSLYLGYVVKEVESRIPLHESARPMY